MQELSNHVTIKEIITTENNRIDDYIYYSIENFNILQSKSIYQLSYDCKEWAFKKGFIYWYENNKLYIKRMFCCKVDFEIDIGIYNKPFDIDIDFKACQWMINNKL